GAVAGLEVDLPVARLRIELGRPRRRHATVHHRMHPARIARVDHRHVHALAEPTRDSDLVLRRHGGGSRAAVVLRLAAEPVVRPDAELRLLWLALIFSADAEA